MGELRVEAGTILGEDFRVIGPLGEGGMGRLYVAEQISTGARRALKVMHPELVKSADMRRRFELEAKVSARIESDFVVTVLGAGVDAQLGIPFIAMELLQGEDLGAHVERKGALALEEARDVLTPLFHAVRAAHEQGIVHRDLKPENVFLARPRRPTDRFTVKVLDFGIAKLAGAASSKATGAVGTPLWMAPEQTRASSEITPAADVWALGLIAFYLLTGKHYWLAASAGVDIEPVALLRELALEPLERADARAARLGHGSELPLGFADWFDRSVERDVARRFADAGEAFDALEPVLGGTPRAPAPPARVDPSQPRPRSAATQTAGALEGFLPDPQRAGAPFVSASPSFEDVPVATAPVARAPEPAPRRRAPTFAVLGGALSAGVIALLLWMKPWASTSPPLPSAAPPATSAAPIASAASAPPSAAPSSTAMSGERYAALLPMVTITGADFTMGSATGPKEEQPPHTETVAPFRIDVTEVTADAYQACVDAGACSRATSDDPLCTAGRPERGKAPINCVDWQQASAFCAWLGRRLPTEAEWELAAKGRSGRLYAWGAQPPGDTRLCWARCNPDRGPCDVGSFTAGDTPEGVKDMTGNIWEWVDDAFCPYGSPGCAATHKVTRGGGWCSSDPTIQRTTTRHGDDPKTKSAIIGFRCARAL